MIVKGASFTHRLLCGDALKMLRQLGDGCVDAVVTSPPYYRLRDYGVAGQYGQEACLDEYLAKLASVLDELLRVTSDVATCFIVIGDSYQDGRLMLVPHRLALVADSVGWVVRNDIIWSKKDPAPGRAVKRWRNGHEHVLFLAKGTKNYCFNDDEIRVPYSDATLRRWGAGQVYGGNKSVNRRHKYDSPIRHGRKFALNPLGCVPTDVWTVASANAKSQHSATFPAGLIEPMLKACTLPGHVVLDPFMGTGTVGTVAKKLDRRFIGVDISPSYVAIARKAMSQA